MWGEGGEGEGTYRTETATPMANGAWKVVEAETSRTD